MQLKNIPTGTIEGTLMGTYLLSGEDLAGEVVLNPDVRRPMMGTSQQDVRARARHDHGHRYGDQPGRRRVQREHTI